MRTVLAITAIALLAGCPGNHTTAMNPVAPPHKDDPSNRIGAAATLPIQVQLTEYEIQMPDTLPAGHQMLHITNAGKQNHNFAIEGPGVQTKLSSDLTRGDAGEIAVDLHAGTYTVYCPVDGHRGKGMQRRVTVK